MSEPIVWPTAPPIEDVPTEDGPPDDRFTDDGAPPLLPPPPPEGEGRPVAPVATRLGSAVLELVLMACTLGFGWVGWWIIAWADGQTPAKVVLHLHAVRVRDGRLATFGQMAVREAVGKAPAGVAVLGGLYLEERGLVALGFAYLAVGGAAALIDNRRRTLWDRLAGTVVLEGDPPPPAALPDIPVVSPLEAGSTAPE